MKNLIIIFTDYLKETKSKFSLFIPHTVVRTSQLISVIKHDLWTRNLKKFPKLCKALIKIFSSSLKSLRSVVIDFEEMVQLIECSERSIFEDVDLKDHNDCFFVLMSSRIFFEQSRSIGRI